MRSISLAVATSFVSLSLFGCADNGDTPTTGTSATGGTTGGTDAAGGSNGVAGQGGSAGASGKGATGGSGGVAGSVGVGGHGGQAGSAAASHGGAGGSTGGAPSQGGATSAGGAAGSSDGGAAGAGGAVDPALLAACTTFWTARCHEWASCDATDLTSSYGDEKGCVALQAPHCAATTLGPASKATVADVTACFTAYGTLDCPSAVRFQYENAPRPTACNYAPGTLAMGAPCVASSECASTFCQSNFLGGGCGVCAKPLATGDACGVATDCPPGDTCAADLLGPPGAGGVCTPYAEKGGACDTVPCHADQACIAGVCADRLSDGMLCDPQEVSCGLLSSCNASKNHCEKPVFAAVGDTCGATADGTQALCPFGSWCRYVWEDATGTCVPRKALGDACELDLECPTFAACIGRVCAKVDPGACEGQAGAGGAGGSGGSGGSGGFDHGAPSTVYPAPHPPLPQAKKGSGSVLKNPVIIPIFFPKDGEQAQYVDFLTKVVGGTYFTVTTSEYGIEKPILAPAVAVTDSAPKSITDHEIRAYLQGKLDGTHPEFTPGGGDPLYTFFYPSTTTIDLFGIESCNGFGGYHDTMIMPDGTAVAYAIIPRCGGIASDTPAVTHELVEAFTDPVVGFPAYSGMEDSHVLWGIDGGEELGDLCEFFKSSTKIDAASGHSIQATWSNASAAASHAPCVPWAGTFFAAAPVMDDDLALPTLGVTTKGVRIPVGGTRTIEVDLFSDGPTTGNITVSALDYEGSHGGTPLLELTIDKTTGLNGEKAALTIKSLGVDPTLGVARFYVRAEVGSARMSWLGVVGE